MTALRALAAIMWILVFNPARERPMAWGPRFLRAPQPSGWTLTDVLSNPRRLLIYFALSGSGRFAFCVCCEYCWGYAGI